MVRILAISDLHGRLEAAWEVIHAARPDLLLCCGDWGDPGEVELPDLESFTARLPVYTVYGNHDNLEALRAWRNRDGSHALLTPGEPAAAAGLTIAGISGIWAKSHRKPFYVTDEDVDAAALALARRGRSLDVLLTHGCPAGVADLTYENRHGGQACFLRAFRLLRPKVYLTGHLHRAQEYRTRDGLVIRNVGSTASGDATLLTADAGRIEVSAFRVR